MADTHLPGDAPRLGERGNRWFAVALGVGVVGAIASAVLGFAGDGDPARFAGAYLVNFTYFLSLGLGALFFVMVTHLVRAGWSVGLRRLSEGIAVGLLPLVVLVVPILLQLDALYEWSHADEVAHDPILAHKQPYLNTTFFVVRIVVYFAIWIGLTLFFTRRSTRQDGNGDPALTLQMERLSAPGIVLFALTLTFAAFDLIMSLAPHWYSTIFGVYYFAGAVVAFFAVLVLVARALHAAGLLRDVVSTEHYHDLGKLAFAFTVFWAYIAFSQYMLIWYGNIPEETAWYLKRQSGDWVALSLVLLFGHFLVPFLLLMSRHPKRRPVVLVLGSVWILAMHWVDLFWLVRPELHPGGVALSLLDLTCFLAIGGFFAAASIRFLSGHPLIPVRDPRLHESLEFENA